ncbi:MAG: hypothetical protein ACLRWQ_13125 [Flavonifractor plautii]
MEKVHHPGGRGIYRTLLTGLVMLLVLFSQAVVVVTAPVVSRLFCRRAEGIEDGLCCPATAFYSRGRSTGSTSKTDVDLFFWAGRGLGCDRDGAAGRRADRPGRLSPVPAVPALTRGRRPG